MPRSCAHGRLYRSLRRASSTPSSAATTIGRARPPARASPRASRTPTTCVHTERGRYILTLYEKRVRREDLPFFLGLMEHLAARGITCPMPVRDRDGRALERAGRPAGGDHHLPRRRVGRGGPASSTARRSARRSPSCISPAPTFRCSGQRPRRSPAGAAVRRDRRRRRRGAAGAGGRDREGACAISGGALAGRSAAGRHPRRPVPRQRVLPRRPAVRADRLLFRLQRHPRLRRRDLPQRLVLRDRRQLQRHQGAGAAAGL